MTTGKVVWVLDHQGAAYHDAQPLLAIRNIDLFVLDRDKLGNFDPTNLPQLARQFGNPDLLIIGKDYADLQVGITNLFAGKPDIWIEQSSSPNASDPANQPEPPFKDATTLITSLTAHFFPVDTPKNPVLHLDPEKSSIAYNGQSIRLTPREFDILNYLYKAPGYNVSRKDFFNQVWKGLKVCNKVLDVHVSNLRKKVRQHGINIQFVKPGSFEMSFVPASPTDSSQ